MSLTAAGRARSRCLPSHTWPIPPEPKGRHEPVAANREPFVQQLVIDLEQRAPAHEDCTLENRPQLANVSRPHVRLESPHGLGRYTIDHLAKLPSVPADEDVDQYRNVLASVHERGHGDLVSGEEPKQGTQAPALPFMGKVASGGGDHPHVGHRRLAAGARSLAILQLLMKLELDRRRKLEDGVKKQSATRSELQLARQQGTLGSSVRPRINRVPTLGVQLGAANEDERARALGGAMYGVSRRLLSCPGRPHQEQGIGPPCRVSDGISEGADGNTVAEQRALDAAAGAAEQLLGDAQLTLERCRPLRDARFERRVRRLQGLGRALLLLVEARVVDRARDLVGDNRDESAIVLAEGVPHRALDREHADQIGPNQQRNGDLALRVGQPGDGHRVSKLLAPTGLHHLASLCRGVCTLLAEIVHVQHLVLLCHDADDARADPCTSTDRLILVAMARHDSQCLAARLEEQDDRVMKLEELIHRPQRDVVDLFQIEGRVDFGGNALQDLELLHLAGELCRIASEGCGIVLDRYLGPVRRSLGEGGTVSLRGTAAGLSRRVVIVLGRSGHSVRKRSIRGTARAPPKPRGKCRPLAA